MSKGRLEQVSEGPGSGHMWNFFSGVALLLVNLDGVSGVQT